MSNLPSMMGTQPSNRQPALFSYHIDLERRVAADHLLRKVAAVLDLSFVLPTVRHCYGRSGNVSVDPRVILKLLLLLFLYDVPSERELMEQIRVRLDFLWFLGFDLESEIPDHSVLSKARARWGTEVFEKLFVQTVCQCVAAGLVDGRLLHVDSTMVKAHAHRDSVVRSGPELVGALRQAYQQQAAKLQVLPEADPAALAPVGAQAQVPAGKVLPVNGTHISTTDPEAQLARSKNGMTELNYKDHRLVDDAQGVVTAVAATRANVADGTQLPGLCEQHVGTTGLKRADVTVAGDHHYGTADNYRFCAQQGIRAHLGEASSHLEQRGKLPLDQFVYDPAQDRLRCPQGHYLECHQERPAQQLKVYLIADPKACAQCAWRERCTDSKRGRSIRRHVEAELVEAARREARSPAARHSRKRRQHVMEGSFADAVNNHGAKKARWRGLWRQRIQSWMIAAVQNLRILLRHSASRPAAAAAVWLTGAVPEVNFKAVVGLVQWPRGLWRRDLARLPTPIRPTALVLP
jgi:transposase